MIEYASKSSQWSEFTPRTYSEHRIGELWRALLGLQGFGNYNGDVWNLDLKPIVSRLAPFLEQWPSIHLCNPTNVSNFAYFLTYPDITEIVLIGLNWLYASATKYGDRFWISTSQQNNSDQAIFSLLNYIWENKKKELIKDSETFAAFRGLLRLQVSRQYQPAMELSVRIGSFR